ncbi:MAG: hypothetical protein C3F11_11775 [Methylocystaceae bacterium]|nr:MAG: hypothetical protein C3F11_11775 [Methylocystaceae bacterium]
MRGEANALDHGPEKMRVRRPGHDRIRPGRRDVAPAGNLRFSGAMSNGAPDDPDRERAIRTMAGGDFRRTNGRGLEGLSRRRRLDAPRTANASSPGNQEIELS